MKIYVGVDIGGTKSKLGIFSSTGDLVKKWSIDTDYSENGKYIIRNVAKAIKEYLTINSMTDKDVLGIGMGIPGPMRADGLVEKCVNLGWYNFNPKNQMQEFFKETKVAGGNDANLAALGEFWKGAGRNYESMVLITLGTGVGSGVVIDGKIIAGAHGLAGEIGHMAVNPEEQDICNCTNQGCVGQAASARGLVNYAKKFMEEALVPTKLSQLEVIKTEDVTRLAQEGDPIAMKTVDYCMGILGKSLAFASLVIDPQVYVIGGGVSAAGETILNPIRKKLNQGIFLTDVPIDVVKAQLGNDAGIYGAVKLVM